MTDITFQRERVHALWTELWPLLEAHYHEIAHYHDIPLDPSIEGYEALEDAGFLRCFTARHDGALIGYAIFMVRANMHYQGSVQAVQDVLFLHPDYRRADTGRSLIRAADDALRTEGVQVVYHHVKHAFDFGPLLASEGYEPVETIHAKRLDLEA